MIIILRVLLFLIPIVGVLLWLRWRVKRDLDEATRKLEFKRLCIGLSLVLIALLATGLGLRFSDDSSGDIDSVYVPARVENGKLIPGRFVPRDELEQDQTPVPSAPPKDPPTDGR